MKIHYIWDAYCGWCYGFNSIFKPFHDSHPELEIEMISGGLFVGDNSKRIGEYGFFEAGNKQIASLFPVEFGEKNAQLIEEATLILDSHGPANAFAVMRELVPQKDWSALAFAIQAQYFVEGKSLSDIQTYESLATQFGIDAVILKERLIQSFSNNKNAEADFIKAYQMGAKSFPTVIAEVNGKYYDFRGQAMSVEDLEQNYQILLKEG
ncbi:DsbA family protein [Macrococcus animalis]|uniref:DsbA family protein n=1 Tax=Macrococcus animalis TaxID=3395467 RepID=UPI0039BDA764